MCFDLDSLPPIPAIAGAAISHDDLELEAADGTSFAAFHAAPDEHGSTGIVVLPDVRGLYRFYEELALRFAERGHSAVAIDYFGRTAGVAKRDEDWSFREHVDQTTPEGIQADVRAAVEYLRSPEGGARTAIFTVGFCFGGSNSWNAAAGGHGLAGAVGFYGRPSRVEQVDRIDAPILALQAGDDAAIPREDSEAFDRELTGAGVEHELVIYDGAPHSFFDRKYDEFADAAADAW
jgi:carboxymethylenebutenolidase